MWLPSSTAPFDHDLELAVSDLRQINLVTGLDKVSDWYRSSAWVQYPAARGITPERRRPVPELDRPPILAMATGAEDDRGKCRADHRSVSQAFKKAS